MIATEDDKGRIEALVGRWAVKHGATSFPKSPSNDPLQDLIDSIVEAWEKTGE